MFAIIEKRGDAYHAYLNGDLRQWEYGCTERMAIAQLCISFPQLLDYIQFLPTA